MSAVHLSPTERHRLASLLGMLGSSQPGERDNAARLAEQFRRQHGLTWADLLAMPPEPVEPAPAPAPAPQTAVERFHVAGAAAYPDWKKRCVDLIGMGCDPELSELLMARPDGVMLVATLADNPQSLAAIAKLKTTRARSAALAKFAASLAARAPQEPKQRGRTPPDDATYEERVRFWEASFASRQPSAPRLQERNSVWVFGGALCAIVLIMLGATFGPNAYQPVPRPVAGDERLIHHHIEPPMKSALPPQRTPNLVPF